MKTLERHISKVLDDRWDDMIALEKRWDAFEARLGGFPAKRRYRTVCGGPGPSTWVWEREWESFAAMEAAYERAMAKPEWAALAAPWKGLDESIADEMYMVLP